MRVLFLILWFPVVGIAVVLLVLRTGGQKHQLLLAVTTGVLGMLWFVGIMSVTLSAYRGAVPDPSTFFDAADRTGESSWWLFGRHYRGRHAGRGVEVFFFPGQGVRLPLVVVEVEARVAGALRAGLRRPLAGPGAQRALQPLPGDLPAMSVLADDGTWARGVLGLPDAKAALIGLIGESEASGSREVHVEPGLVRLRAHPAWLDDRTARGWIARLADLAAALEAAFASGDPD